MVDVRRSLFLHAPLRRSPHHVLRTLQARMPEGVTAGDPVEQLEQRIRTLLGTEAALFFPTGTMAQQTALRIHSERTARKTFAAHPQTHLAIWEEHGYAAVHGLRFHALGDWNRLFTMDDLDQVGEPLAALVIELPQRDIGGLLPTWDDLVRQTGWARQRGTAAHLDGARLWEAETAYEQSFAEIAGLFDTTYVSLYKGLEGVRGAVLAGDAATIKEAAVWRQRLGGAIPDAWPLAAIALVGLDETLPRMAEFRDHAVALAAAINADGVAHTVPIVPLTPIFHVQMPRSKEAVERAAADLLEGEGVQVLHRVRTSPDPDRSSFEVIVGVNAMDFAPDELAGIIRRLASPELGRRTVD